MQSILPVPETLFITGDVIATDVSYEAFLSDFDGQHVEWVNGVVIKMPTVGTVHNRLTRFSLHLVEDFMVMSGTDGDIFHDPMVMKTSPDLPGRAPDIFVVLSHKRHLIKANEIAGAADLVMEIVSPGSQRQDRIEKYAEYEKGGVPEYWVIDPTRREALFYQLNEHGIFDLISPDADGVYYSRVLKGFKIAVNIFWQEFPPQGPEITKMVEAMLKDAE
jgi:Uma2 family endonuclease